MLAWLMEHSGLASHSYAFNSNNVYTAIRGEVFNFNTITSRHTHIVNVRTSAPSMAAFIYRVGLSSIPEDPY
jgi:hypothetical protein